MKTFPTLYKRTKTGAIQYWHIFTLQAATNDHVSIQKESGQLGTESPIKHVEWVTQGKNIGKANETTKMQQANLQAESDWKKKRDEGYKSLEDLSIKTFNNGTYALKSAGAEKVGSLADALADALPQFNTDASGNPKPMLAKTVNWDKVKYPCLIQPKLDGVRCLMILEEQEVKFLSRSGKEYNTLSHIKQDVEDYIGAINDAQDYRFILDGEIYSEELSFQDIVAAVKKHRPDSLKLRFRAYDLVNSDKQSQRLDALEKLVNDIFSSHITLVETRLEVEQTGVKTWHDFWVSQGYEGAMIRHMDGMYGQGQRSSDLLKVKEFDETEFRAKFLYTGQREEDLLVMCETKEGKEFTAKLTGNREYKADLVKEHGLEQKLKLDITIKHFGWTDDGLPRFPIGKAFRDE